jgi:integrase
VPRNRLSELFIAKIKAPKVGRAEYFDSAEPGLVLRVTPAGHKSWSVVYRNNRRLKRYTIGPYAEGKARVEYDLATAREKAREAKARIRDGGDPAEEKRTTRLTGGTGAGTFKAVADDWLARHVERNCAAATFRETRRMFGRDVFGPKSTLASRKIESVTFADIDRLIGGILNRGAGVYANRMQKRLQALFNWAVAKRIIEKSPIAGMPLPTVEKSRDRFLGDKEIVWFWQACEEIGWPFGPLFQLLLLTGQRRDEVGQMEWAELDLDKAIWTQPARRAKNGREHIVHLSEQALAVLKPLPRIGRRYVFSRDADNFVTGFSWAKGNLDEAMAKAADCSAIPRFTLHDLRRSAATGMASINIAPHVVERILNHTGGTIRGVAAIYNKAQYLPEREQALKAWGNYVEALVNPRSNVVRMSERA